MLLKKTLLLTASVSAISLSGAYTASAQSSAMDTNAFNRDDSHRLRSEVAGLYASTISRISEIVLSDISSDTGVTVINNMRNGRMDLLPSIDAETLDLARSLNISAIVVDADDSADSVDERIIVFAAEDDLSRGVTRADIEERADASGYNSLVRFQNNQVVGGSGSFAIPDEAPDSVRTKAIGTWIGISGLDKITSSNTGTKEVRVLECESGFYGTGITEERENARVTNLAGNVTDSFGGWMEISRDCSPEATEQVRFFDVCAGPDGILGTGDDDLSGQSLYEASRFIRKDLTDPFEVEVFLDESTAILVNEAECLTGDRVSSSSDFLVNGRTQGANELSLKLSTASSDIGNGPGTVPEEVSPAGVSSPISGIPFPADDVAEFQYSRSCVAEYGAVTLPSGFSGPSTFNGSSQFYRDYNRRETYFSDNRLEYILNYDIITDPNPYGHGAKGRGVISGGPSGDGWYKFTETCEREITRPENSTRTQECSIIHPAYPNGSVQQSRVGIGYYDQTTFDNPLANGPTQTSISWNPWTEVSNNCYNTSETRTDETRQISVSSGGQTCSQPQVRTAVVRTNNYESGTSDSSTTYDPNWTNSGSPINCAANTINSGSNGSPGHQSVDVDGDGVGDYQTESAAAAAGNTSFDIVNGVVGVGSTTSGSSGGGGGGGGGCFSPDTPVLMADGTEKRIDDIKVGDEIAEGGVVLVSGSFLSDDIFQLDGVRVTATHIVKGEDAWVRVEDHPRAVREITRWQKTCNLITSNNRMICGGKLFADQTEFGGVFLDEIMSQGEEDRISQMNTEFAKQFAFA